ncbi:hypothetical protein E3U23_07085 [Erythrobacter litoralis]|uniref:hypothetical protein n=1 Tax=Erythrobacter litoralis TaxID=39960 RepID=UPI002435D792|nr:hypothetical protein [Erythrobacter litoralis]MDG6078954.1 hypothetical protein [Erythrobacter litoralis]
MILLAALGVAGCAAHTMQLPPSLAAASSIVRDITGTQGSIAGAARVGDSVGRYQRSFVRVTVLEADRRDAGSMTMAISGAVAMQADCRLSERSIGGNTLQIRVTPFQMSCDLINNQGVSGQLELFEIAEPVAGPIVRTTRAGGIRYGGKTFDLLPNYRMNGQDVSHATPVGYILMDAGSEIAAIETDTSPRLIVRDNIEVESEEIAVAAALILTTFWDKRTMQ